MCLSVRAYVPLSICMHDEHDRNGLFRRVKKIYSVKICRSLNTYTAYATVVLLLTRYKKYRAYNCMWPSKYLENGDERISRLVCLCEMKTLTWETEIEKKGEKRSERGSIHCLQTKFTVHVCQKKKTGENTFFSFSKKKETQLWIEITSNFFFFLFIINNKSRTISFRE